MTTKKSNPAAKVCQDCCSQPRQRSSQRGSQRSSQRSQRSQRSSRPSQRRSQRSERKQRSSQPRQRSSQHCRCAPQFVGQSVQKRPGKPSQPNQPSRPTRWHRRQLDVHTPKPLPAPAGVAAASGGWPPRQVSGVSCVTAAPQSSRLSMPEDHAETRSTTNSESGALAS